jgi:D-inositol-3-phosphate glycosyltransferase
VKLNPHPLFDNYGTPVSRNESLAALHLDDEYRYLLFFGFIRAYKGLDLLIKAFADRRLRKKKLKLIVAGEFYEDDAPYRQMIKLYDLEKDIILLDHFIRDADVPFLFCAADLVVQPYKSATQSGVTQIAFHYEKPMLVTEVGGLREIVRDGICGYVVKLEPEEIAAAIIDFFENDRLEKFSEGVRNEKEKFLWDKMTASVIEVYDKCITKRQTKS